MDVKTASLFRNGRSQALRIPREFELPGSSVSIRRLPNGHLEISPLGETGLLAAFKDEPPLPEEHWMDAIQDLPAEPVDP
ncbi:MULTISPECIES: antitoxin [Methylobacterium]|jgi:antitoxin VapB|uniref:AbrB/MazE/SpoVT family DNA-binding domain-containing protein n=1 Tax=Methylobacterium brachiatum TaxID=269660 RepID=A0ABV1QWG7_9HYPH|nr:MULTISPECIES: AbrB/MazE/SpoVT family DNA-binding domain-containing protein [Methylobacterium]AYO82897.1 AbrB/MazE/SpoVT family DNA-binding domain-containing protein [Methylobacterium brachiatum]EIZ82230.1 nitrogen regulatory protein [Methylobacterium sp. GXF4]MDH2308248.1 AbrB/MazE/SpoVT family DNA-binding domain-containing protein [Methylobacterium brachiatum]SFH96552.1 antitoxin VapB [Methylobacterium brachiatum]